MTLPSLSPKPLPARQKTPPKDPVPKQPTFANLPDTRVPVSMKNKGSLYGR